MTTRIDELDREVWTLEEELHRQRVACAVCGKKRIYPSSRVDLVSTETVFGRMAWTGTTYAFLPTAVVPAGGYVCWTHIAQPKPAENEPMSLPELAEWDQVRHLDMADMTMPV